MKPFKKLIYCLVLPVLFIAGCSEQVQKEGGTSEPGKVDTSDNGDKNPWQGGAIIESDGDLIIDIHDGNGNYPAFRMLNDSAIYWEVREIIDNADWKVLGDKRIRSGDYRIQSIDRTNEENPMISTIYYLSANPDRKTVELFDSDHLLYTELDGEDSEKLFKILVDENLSDHVGQKN